MRPLPELTAALLLSAGGASASDEYEDLVRLTLEAELAETRTPGAALVIVRGDEVLLSKGFGVATRRRGSP